jgi:hypothetical protein
MKDASSTSQWERLLCHLGAWQGSFTRLSPQGTLCEDSPSLVTLTGLNQNQTIRQTIQHFSPETGELQQNNELEYSSLGRGVLFFEDGSFSQGSIQFSPFSEFGAEMGFIQGDRRLRLVQLFDKESCLTSFTLIREHRQDTPKADSPALTLEQLIGDWQGEAVTLYPDLRPPDRYHTTLSVQQQGDRLHQRLTAPQMELASTAKISGPLLLFEQGNYPVQVLLLPGGASSNTPLAIPRRQPFFLEAGWLVEENFRQRLIRSYDANGEWSSLTLINERRGTM